MKVVAVTVLEDRASVTRRGALAVQAGQQRVVIEQVSPVLVDKTLAASATGARVLDVRCERYVAPWREDPQGVNGLRAERARLEAARDAALARAELSAGEVASLQKLATRALHDLAVAATRGASPDGAAAQLAELDASEAAARERNAIAVLELDDVQPALVRLDERIARAEAEAGEQAARLVIDLVADAAGEATVTASYVVPGAAWRPYHRAQLHRDAGKLDWQTTACVWQATGEDWIDAELLCSLERPSLGTEPPELDDDVLHARKKPDTVVVEAREQEEQTTGLGGGGSGAAEVPGIDDGGLGLRLAAGKVTVRGDGMPHRVAVGGFSAPAQLSLVAIPSRSPWVHLRARVANAGTQPLLAGPVDLILAAGYAGRAEIGFVAAGEKFHVGFGPESDVRAHRTETRERDEAGLLGGWNTQTVRVAVRLSNLGAHKREIVVTERVPISEVEQVQVQTAAADAYLLADEPGGEEITQVTARAIDERGLVSWTVELPPHGRRAVTLEYKLKSQKSVAGI
ncbi:MAG TPA: mucoidy inhibitor MuiA family protein [Kofleriaceae bacterium]|nr:mucoidy inhibitor MuiA family protein [Kofleriaceae bacterium]